MKSMPSFWDSEYLVKEDFNIHLKDNAPEELKEEFKKWQEEDDCFCIGLKEKNKKDK